MEEVAVYPAAAGLICSTTGCGATAVHTVRLMTSGPTDYVAEACGEHLEGLKVVLGSKESLDRARRRAEQAT